jgi:opacity protein-like surface antigen
MAVALGVTATEAVGQSRQPWSLQASGEWVIPTKDYGTGLQSGSTLGWELQLRHTFGRFSLGAGYQRSTVFKSDAAELTGTISVGFVEPRYVVTVLGERAAPYLAGRLGYGALLIRKTPRVTTESFTYGGGAGVMIAVSRRIALDAGGQYFVADFGGGGGTAGYFLARLGIAVGLF